jgi:hypothetical protein
LQTDVVDYATAPIMFDEVGAAKRHIQAGIHSSLHI